MRSLLFLLFFISFFAQAQTHVSGTVLQKNGTPVFGANVYIKNSYDGATTDEKGWFEFTTSETGMQTLVVSYISFESVEITKDISEMTALKIMLESDLNTLETVTISAGSFSAGDQSKVNYLKPLDIVTTASAVGDVMGALQTLPGTSMNAEDGRLFVRGGEAGETQIFIDGIRVFTPYTTTADNTPARGRYSPFLFDGITFSTGGYSAEFGQALSSVLLLNTIDEKPETQTDISIMSLGAGLGHTQKWNKSSATFNASYINLAPYTAVFPERNEWKKPYQGFSGEGIFRQQIGDGLLKVYNAFETTDFALVQENINHPEGIYVGMNEKNFYSNVSFRNSYSKGWSLFAGGSFTYSQTGISLDTTNIADHENDFHFKIKARKRFSNKFILNFGTEHFATHFSENIVFENGDASLNFNQNISALYAEADVIFSRRLAIKPGARMEYDHLLEALKISPRMSLAYKLGKNNQLSFAYGTFLQAPEKDVLKFQTNLKDQRAAHYILNFEHIVANRIFRAEVYRKDYSNLITFQDENDTEKIYSNDGNGYAQGFDLFFRDNKSFKNTDYWVSYSFIDTQRKYRDYPVEATPSFVNKHNFSLVTKYWINALRTQVGFSYQFASGRSYTDKNKPGFLQEKAKSYNNISVNAAYLISRQKILYFSVSNIAGFKNSYGYEFADSPDSNGMYQSRKLQASRDQFFFVGFFWTISSDKSSNQLKNL